MGFGMFGPRTVGQKLRTLIVAAPCLVLAATSAIGYLFAAGAMKEEALRKFGFELDSETQELDDLFRRVSVLPRCIAARQVALPHPSAPDPRTPDVLLSMLETAAPEGAVGLYIAFDGINPLERPEGVQWVDRESKKEARVRYNHNAPLPQTDWYRGAKRKCLERRATGLEPDDGDHYVTEPYFDRGAADALLVSVTRGVEDRQGRFIGVAGVDMKCTSLNAIVRAIVDERGERGRGSAADGVVAYLLSPGDKVIARTDGRPLPEEPEALGGVEGRSVGEAPSSPPEGVPIVSGRVPRLLFWRKARDSNWKVVLSVPEATILAPARRMALWSAALGAGSLALMVLIVSVLADRVTGPIPKLTAAAAAVEAGDYRADGLGGIAERRDEFGQLARGFRSMVAEVSAREDQLRQAHEDIRRRERHFRSLIENASDIITVLDRDGTIRYESPSVRRILGYEPEQLVGAPRFELVHPDDAPVVAGALERRGQAEASDRPVEYRFRHKDGSWRTLEATSTDLLDDPAVGGIVVNSRDVTERKRAQDELDELRRRHAEELEKKVLLRTAELAQSNEELRAAKEATDQAMRQQEVFLSNVAHDLRTPLTIVIGYSEDLLRRARKKGQDAFIPDLELIVNRGKDLLELINDLLNMSKAMNDRGVDLDLKCFEVAAMIRSRMEGIGSIARKYGNAVEFLPAEGLGSMLADEAKVWRILMNLLTNACKFTKDGRVTLAASREAGPAGDRVVFRVADTGVGMGPEQTARLFDRFAQVHADSGKMQAGVGLGLSICMLYCKAMGGAIAVESEPGRGTTFLVTLPAEVGAAPDAPPAPRPAAARTPVSPRDADGPTAGDRANLVLIIDDDASICELMRRILGEEGFRSTAALSGEEGLRLAKQLLPSAIILDVVMPGIDGWAVLAALKTDAKTAEIPIIMASMLDEKERGLRMGADEYVAKPLGRDELTDLLHKHLGGRPSARILVVEDDADCRRRVCTALRAQGWEADEAADGDEALARLGEAPTDLIVLDLMLPGRSGLEVVAEVRSNPAWEGIPILVVTAADLDAEARGRLKGQVERVLSKGLLGRDDLLREVRTLVSRQHPSPVAPPEVAHA